MLNKIFAAFRWCKICKAMTRWKKDNDKIWYCTKCGSDC